MNLLKWTITLISIKVVTCTFCFWNTGCPYKYFSNKTPYNFIRGDIRDSLVKLVGCEPVSIWGIIRHGQRNPGPGFGKEMKEVLTIRDYIKSSYEKGNSSLCAQDVENLLKWQPHKDIFDKPFKLTKEGYLEAEGIARRLHQAFPNLLAELEKNDYLIRPAEGEWMADSAKGFVEGFNNKRLSVQPAPARDVFDIIAPYFSCGKYLSDVKNNPKTYAESEKYQRSSDYLVSKDRIQRRLGIEYSLTDTNITALYDLCRYDSSGLPTKFSPWCALFTTEDLKVMEYVADLRHYYKSGYGTPMNERLGQFPLADLFKSFQDMKNGKGKKLTSYITHATMMDMVHTALKLFKDDTPLTGSQKRPKRKWRSSKLATFSTNLLVVLNKCKGPDDYNVVFYLNEEPLISICKEGVCTWKEFEDKLSPFLEKRNNDVCEFIGSPS